MHKYYAYLSLAKQLKIVSSNDEMIIEVIVN